MYGVPQRSKQCLTSYACPATRDGNKRLLPVPVIDCPSGNVDCCNDSLYVCDEAHYDQADVYPGQSSRCEFCTVSEAVVCAKGFYARRCKARGASDYNCLPCTNAFNGSGLQYGRGALSYPACDGTNTLACALYLTPLFDAGACALECVDGFTNVGTVAAPLCEACETACAAGLRPNPECYLGGGAVGQKACVPCVAGLLPPNASYRLGCNWTCNGGYSLSPSTGLCVACALQTCAAGYAFVGCVDGQAGGCSRCPDACDDGFYLRSGLYSPDCSCQPCTTLQSESSYIRERCDATRDAVVAPCRTCDAARQFAQRRCETFQDTVCSNCSFQPARLLVAACTANADAVYESCPYGMACDGTSTARYCEEHMVASNGVCVCSPGYVRQQEGCVARSCPPLQYPSNVTGECTWCFEEDSPPGLVVAGVVGLGACACRPGYFLRYSGDDSLVHCWPCGDLGCVGRVQSPCPGWWSQDEPECLCAPPFGAVVVDESCTFGCPAGYLLEEAAPGVYSQTPGLLYGGALSYSVALEAGVLGVAALLNDAVHAVLYADRVVLHFGGRNLTVGASRVSSSLVLRGLPSFTGITASLDFDDGFWVSYTYFGYCDGNYAAGGVACSTVSHLRVSARVSGERCSLFASGEWCVGMVQGWGNALPAGSSAYGAILGLAAGREGGRLTFVQQQLGWWRVTDYQYRWPCATCSGYNDTASVLWRGSDRPVSAAFALGVLYLSLEGRGVFRLTTASELEAVLPLPERLFPLLQGLLGVGDGSGFVDGWNRLAHAPSSSGGMASLGTSALAVAVGSELRVYGGVRQCAVDSVSYDGVGCVAMPCRLGEPCGALTLRARGGLSCTCPAGFYGAACAVCPADHFCPAGGELQACSRYSTSSAGSASMYDCLCQPGYYRLGSSCFPCSANAWCPGGTTIQVPCFGRGSSVLGGLRASPLECECPPRTHGLLCEACADDARCLPSPGHTLSALRVRGASGAWNSSEQLERCLAPWTHVVYHDVGGLWDWHVVVLDAQQLGNLSACMGSGFSVEVYGQGNAYVRESVACGPNREWSGVGETCVCIGGYEQVWVRGSLLCAPCLNGTVRPRRELSGACAPCALNDTHAPYLGMEACVDVAPERPSPPLLDSPLVSVGLTAAAGAICLLVAVLCA